MKKALKIIAPLLGLVLLGFAATDAPRETRDLHPWTAADAGPSRDCPAAASLGVLGIGIAGILTRRQRRKGRC